MSLLRLPAGEPAALDSLIPTLPLPPRPQNCTHLSAKILLKIHHACSLINKSLLQKEILQVPWNRLWNSGVIIVHLWLQFVWKVWNFPIFMFLIYMDFWMNSHFTFHDSQHIAHIARHNTLKKITFQLFVLYAQNQWTKDSSNYISFPVSEIMFY